MSRLSPNELQVSRKQQKSWEKLVAKRFGRAQGKPRYAMFDNIPHKINHLSGLYRQSSTTVFFAALKIGRPEVRLLHILGHRGPLASHEVVALAAMDKAMVSRATKNLIDSKHIKQQKDPDDQRRSILSLTKKGEKSYDFVLRTTIERHDKAIEKLSAQDCCYLDDMLDRLIESAEEMLKASAVRGAPRRKAVD